MIVYLHGFSSAAISRKATQLKQRLMDYDFFVPNYPSHQPVNAVASLREYLAKLTQHNNEIMLIGSSLGGYYAQYLGSVLDDVKKVVLINPALQPQQTLGPHIGTHTNVVTGELFDFTQSDFDGLAQFEVPSLDDVAKTLVLLDEGDDVINYEYAAFRYRDAGRIVIYPGGSHWFDHLEEALPEVIAFNIK